MSDVKSRCLNCGELKMVFRNVWKCQECLNKSNIVEKSTAAMANPKVLELMAEGKIKLQNE